MPAIFSPPSLYPVIHKENSDGGLDPAEEIDLEEEAAAYERERYDPPFVAPIKTQEKRSSLQRLKWSQPPPYVPSQDYRAQPSAPPSPVTLLPLTPGIDSLLATKQSLTSQITQLRGVISLQKELKDLTSQIQTLQVDLLTPSSLPPAPIKLPNGSPQARIAQGRPSKARPAQSKRCLTFPVVTRSRGTAPSDNEDDEGDEEGDRIQIEEAQEGANIGNIGGPAASSSCIIQIEEDPEGADTGGPATSSSRIIKTLKIKHLKELHSAVKNYGPAAPFTLSILKGLGQGGNLVPNEWTKVAQSVLSRSQYLTQKAELMEKLEAQADVNKQNVATASRTLDKSTGRGKYATESKQQALPAGLLNQLTQAAPSRLASHPPPPLLIRWVPPSLKSFRAQTSLTLNSWPGSWKLPKGSWGKIAVTM